MKRAILGIAVSFAAAGTGYLTFAHGRDSVAAAPKGAAVGSLREEAIVACKAGDFEGAMTFWKRWMNEPAALADKGKLSEAVLNIVMIQQWRRDMQAGKAVKTGTGNVMDDPGMLAAVQALVQAQASPGEIAMGADRVPHLPMRPGEVRAMAIKEMANFLFDPERDTDVPTDVKFLDGGRVKLTGYMMPLTQAEKITDFALVPTLGLCCTQSPPGVEHTVTCHAPENATVDFSVNELEVEGVLHVRVKREDNYTYSIFELDVVSVKEKE